MWMTRRLLLGHGVRASFLLSAGTAAAAEPHREAREHAIRHGRWHRPPLKPLVVIDPGHGGKDPGAIGITGTYEKHIALLTALDLRRALLASGRYRVHLTRSRDIFIPLDGRVEIAQRVKADLFVSMHADALTNHAVRGASVYTLSGTASDAQTAALAARENSADRFLGPSFGHVSPEVARILASLVQRETRLGSARMADDVVSSLRSEIRMLTNPDRHAGFVVLKAANIPSVLVEMGFMSNRRDEAELRRPAHRALVAASMRRAVETWFSARNGVTHLS